MQKQKQDLLRSEQGAIALEACIALTLFLITMMALYSLIHLFTAQSMIAHALQQTGQSIAMENYRNEKLNVATTQRIPLAILKKITGGWGQSEDAKFDIGGGSFTDPTVLGSVVPQSTVTKRFASYLGGNEEKADQILRSMGVVDGLKGIHLSKKRIGGIDAEIEISYKIRLVFYIEMFHFGEFESTQKVCCRRWK